MEDVPTGNETAHRLEGMLVPFNGNEPVLLTMGTTGKRYVPIFRTDVILFEMMKGIEFETIKIIKDQEDFIRQIPPDITLAIDFRRMPNGKTRWSEPKL